MYKFLLEESTLQAFHKQVLTVVGMWSAELDQRPWTSPPRPGPQQCPLEQQPWAEPRPHSRKAREPRGEDEGPHPLTPMAVGAVIPGHFWACRARSCLLRDYRLASSQVASFLCGAQAWTAGLFAFPIS